MTTSKFKITCKHQLRYNYDFDAVYCPECLIWIDPNCGKADCNYCKDRPEKPFGTGHDATNDDDYERRG